MIGSALTTILAMTFGFKVVLVLALMSYALALSVLRGMRSETTVSTA